ncbi:MAG TPA: 2-oxo acid dehydrogenase subunit E2 [Bacteroidales bacterium]|nr:2-oxo acid dehydrogenase subunit E2 [Bacteroidales bacterium]
MAREIKLPEISENIDTATVVRVLVAEGDKVDEDQSLIEIETEKAASDVPSPAAGTIKEVKVQQGDEIKVGSVILILEEGGGGEEEKEQKKAADKEEEQEQEEGSEEKDEKEGKEEAEDENAEEKESGEKETGKEKEDETEQEEKETSEKEEKESEEEKKEEQRKESTKSEGKSKSGEQEQISDTEKQKGEQVPASPSVRRFAREIGIDITQVKGTAPGNRITMDDVKAYSKEKNQQDKKGIAGAAGFELPDFSKWGDTERKPMSKVRQITAKNTLQSWNSIPHVTQFDKADITNLENFRKQYAGYVEKAGGKLTVTAILLKIAGFALQQFPRFNSSLDSQRNEIVYKKYIHIGVAVDTDRGLLVPVIRDVDKKSITALAVELGEMAEKARNKKISPDEMEGGNFTISNLGGLGGTAFTPVIFPPQVSIMGVSCATTEPVYADGAFQPRQILPLNISYDHRVIDGADGARFLRWVCEALENPFALFLKEGGE